MRAAVVENEVQRAAAGHRAVDLLEEPHEVGAAVLLSPSPTPCPSPRRRRRRGWRSRGACNRASAGQSPGPHREHGLRPIERLHLRLLIHRERHGVVRRGHVEPDHVRHLLGKLGVATDLEGLQPMRRRSAAFHTCATIGSPARAWRSAAGSNAWPHAESFDCPAQDVARLLGREAPGWPGRGRSCSPPRPCRPYTAGATCRPSAAQPRAARRSPRRSSPWH